MLARINRARREAGFEPVSEEIRTLEFAETLGVGKRRGEEPTIMASQPNKPPRNQKHPCDPPPGRVPF